MNNGDESATLQLNEPTRRLIYDLENKPVTVMNRGEKLHTTESNQLAYEFYERFRNTVQYREQHLFLRNAIARFLVRNWRLLGKTQNIGESLIAELVKTRYIENDYVSQETLLLIDSLLFDYQKLLDALHDRRILNNSVENEIIEIASCEIDRLVVDRSREEAYVHFVFHQFLPRLDPVFYEEHSHQDVQFTLFGVIHRLLMKSDAARIRYYIFYSMLPNWRQSIPEAANSYQAFSKASQQSIRGSLERSISRVLRRKMAPFRLLFDVLRKYEAPSSTLTNREVLEEQLTYAATATYQRTTVKLRRSIVRAIIFIFITKLSLALLIELPYDLIVHGAIDWLPLALNIIFPPLFMILISLGIKRPKIRNTTVLVQQIFQILQASPESQKPIKPRDNSGNQLFALLYSIMFAISISMLTIWLVLLGFNLVSGFLFFIFFSTVSFFGMKITSMTREYTVVSEKTSIISLLFDIFYTPFVRVGQWLSDSYARFNFFAISLDILVELPFKSILTLVEGWAKYLRERQDDLL
ncbi:hypothetical protein KA529_00845 [Candidatus Saccharibacteria bacterium]|jgi:hypothetical protein|nr:hypothetical protein [Candidatus Saccharibacteria bacterium]